MRFVRFAAFVIRSSRHEMTDRKLKTFGAYIRNQRETAGIPLNIFARDLGISPAYWSRIERDMEKPPQDKWLILATARLNISSDDVFVAAGRLPLDMRNHLARVVRIYRKNTHRGRDFSATPGPIR